MANVTAKSTTPWLGIHLIVGDNAQMDALAGEVPTLAGMGINVLMTEINYSYAYASHPELRAANPITADRVRALVKVCRAHGVRLIPQFQCLGHQSWSANTFPLLIQYPQFDRRRASSRTMTVSTAAVWCRSTGVNHHLQPVR